MDTSAFDPPIGVAEDLAPGLRRLLAPNPGPMTFRGTNTYMLGTAEVTVIDPGPDDDAHLDAILAAAGAGRVVQILVTHAHLDHSALAARLAAATGAPVLSFGGAQAGRSDLMARLAADGLGGGEGIHAAFSPDLSLPDATTIATEAGPVGAIWTPGHMGNHLCFLWNGSAFSGDLVMGWASSLISPPDGDVAAFRASCLRLKTFQPERLWPGHGAPVESPAARIDALLRHRAEREAEILAALAAGPARIGPLTAAAYTDVPPATLPAAERNVLAHLIDLVDRGAVTAHPRLAMDAVFSRPTG